MGGGRVAPNPSNEVDIYDPVSNTWTTGTPVPAFATARRNFPTDTDGTAIWLAGGYGPSPLSSTEIFHPCITAPTVTSAVSRKIHGAAGPFDIVLPTTGTTGVECRSGGATNDFTMVVTFDVNVTVTGSPQAQVTMGTGIIGSGGVSNGGMVTVAGNVVTIPLTNVADHQTIDVTLNGVNAAIDEPAANVVIPMSLLLGDTNDNRKVNATDIAQTKARIGQALTNANFRSDIDESGGISSNDVLIIKANTGNGAHPIRRRR